MNKDVQIFVVTHKEVNLDALKLDKCYHLIRVGNYAKSADSSEMADNTGDNIADKNPNYCELTAHYWIWKNCRTEIVGLCHYRRYFSDSIFSNDAAHILNTDQIVQYLDQYDVILPYRPVARRTVKQIYLDFGFEKDLEILRDVIKEKHKDYLEEYDALLKRHSNYPANMLICKKKLFDAYSAWLFDILFEVEKRTDLTSYTVQQARIYGYMSERLLEVWVRKHNLRIKHFRMLKVDEPTTFRAKAIDVISTISNGFKY